MGLSLCVGLLGEEHGDSHVYPTRKETCWGSVLWTQQLESFPVVAGWMSPARAQRLQLLVQLQCWVHLPFLLCSL